MDHHHGTRKLLKQPSHLLKHKLKTYTDSLTQNTDRRRHRSPKPNTHRHRCTHMKKCTYKETVSTRIYDFFLIQVDGQSSWWKTWPTDLLPPLHHIHIWEQLAPKQTLKPRSLEYMHLPFSLRFSLLPDEWGQYLGTQRGRREVKSFM